MWRLCHQVSGHQRTIMELELSRATGVSVHVPEVSIVHPDSKASKKIDGFLPSKLALIHILPVIRVKVLVHSARRARILTCVEPTQ